MASSIRENLASQKDEISALCSIYGTDFHIENESNRTFSVEINESLKAKLEITLPADYPSKAPPSYTLHSPWLKGSKRQELCGYLDAIYRENYGENLIYLWVERIRQFIIDEEINLESEARIKDENIPVSSLTLEDSAEIHVPCPEIFSGEIITDRKSHFQPHLANVHSVDEVRAVLKKLQENKKIANATHNMYAYRFMPPGSSSLCQDCDDDGETHAGSRMLHLLQILDAKNVVVVVSRWFGGIQLGPDRFKHINNAARQILESCGHLKDKAEEKKKKKGK